MPAFASKRKEVCNGFTTQTGDRRSGCRGRVGPRGRRQCSGSLRGDTVDAESRRCRADAAGTSSDSGRFGPDAGFHDPESGRFDTEPELSVATADTGFYDHAEPKRFGIADTDAIGGTEQG